MSRKVQGNFKTTSLDKSIYYAAPEVLQGYSSTKSDIWSLGVILFVLVTGQPPFKGRRNKEIE